MDIASFEFLLQLIEPKITKQNTRMRQSVTARERLIATLRYLATGRTYADMKFTCAISPQLLGKIIPETCKELFMALKDDFIKFPSTTEDWLEVARGFANTWNFEHCLGAMDGKHIAIKQPPHSGSYYFNYKSYYSIVLFAVVNANYEYLYIHTGTNGRVSDGGVIQETDFYDKLENGLLNLPPPSILRNSQIVAPYVFIGDDAFQLSDHVMKPYRKDINTPRNERIFNYRLCRARRTVENAFGITACRFRVLLSTISLENVNNIDYVVMACCALHNFLRRNSSNYMTIQCMDHENHNHTVTPGEWRQEQSHQLHGLLNRGRNCEERAKVIRKLFTEYYNNEGQVAFQSQFI
ncbi:putative nuclease HARBI1 [Helicoverpa zea]|nr:putative nuclease HARBI1 [Helicoverpa zea]